jgi:hypothetical protein
VAFICDELAGCAPAFLEWNGAAQMFQRYRFRYRPQLEERLAEKAKLLREEAKLCPPGAVREAMIRKARQCEIGSDMTERYNLRACSR